MDAGQRREERGGAEGERQPVVRLTDPPAMVNVNAGPNGLRRDAKMGTRNDRRPAVQLKPSSYQPSTAELEEDVSIDAPPEALRRAVLRQVRVEVEEDA